MFNKRAEVGIGTLIIFIALILIATISASILISTNASVQDKAIETGKQATNMLTNLDIIEITGEDGTTGSVRTLQLLSRLAVGSEPINFENMIITLSLFDESTTFIYRDGLSEYDEFDGFYTNGDTGFYTVDFISNNENAIPGSIQKDDLVKVYLYAPRNIASNENLRFNFIYSEGTSKKIEFSIPNVISNKLESLYP